jgi:hypothetical protein
MATLVIKYLPKHTGANTQYREISEEDKQILLTRCIQALSTLAEYDRMNTTDNEDQVWCRDAWWHKRTKKLNKGANGLNSPCSTLGGIIHNFMFKTPLQYDLSNKQMDDLEFVFKGLAAFEPSIEPIRFQVGFGD